MFDAQKNCNDLTATGNEVKISTTHWCEPLLGGGFHKFAQKKLKTWGLYRRNGDPRTPITIW
jgi:hypothetical protein